MDCARCRIRHKRHYGQRIDTTFTPPNILARDQLNPYLQAVRRKEVEQWQSGADHNVIANSLGKSIAHSSTARIPYSEFSPLTLIGTAFPQRNEVRTHLSWINGNRPVDCARCCRSIFAMYVRANSSILMFALTVTCRTNPVRVPGVIVRLCSLGWPTGLHGQVKL